MSSPDRQTTDPLPLPSSPDKPDTLTRSGRPDGATDGPGIPFAGQSGVADAGSGAATDTDSESGTDAARQTASARPAPAGTPAPHGQPAAPAGPSTTSAPPAGADGAPGHDDGVLDSIGKAISSPIRGAAEDEEPK